MPTTELLIAFLAATAVFAYMPGPAMLYAAAQTMSGGRSAGLVASLGIHLGGYAHVIAAAAGLSVLFHAVPVLYTLVKLAGAAYLVWLGIRLIRQAGEASLAPPLARAGSASGRPAFLESVAVEVLNPKTALFFLAFLPQFTDASAPLPIWTQLLLLGTIVNLMFSSADLICVLLAGAALERLRRSSRAQRIARRAGGAILIGLGINLAMHRQ
jgi:threonine/homoserine/homoserine lactone efflux protein